MSEQKRERVLVTGGCGFIGSHLIDRLIELGHEVAIMDNLCSGRIEDTHKKCEMVKMDITADQKKMDRVFEKFRPDTVFHLAAQKDLHASMVNPVHDAEVNILGSLHVLEAMRKTGGGRVVFASTAAVYSPNAKLPITEDRANTDPVSPYGISKHTAEMYMRNYSNMYPVATISLRFSNAFGPRGCFGTPNVIDIFARKMMQGEPVIIYGSGEQTRDFVYIDDMVDAFLRAMRVAWCGEVNIATNTEVSINQVARSMAEAFGVKLNVKYEEARDGELFQNRLDPSLAVEAMGWRPKTSFAEGLKRTVEWYKHHHNIS
ncbi:MAG: NAD-dependent epimerase/dehydratase family protein [Patescibacteria group bacterium]